MNLLNKNILIGVPGSIAIYRVFDLITSLKSEGANVKVILTNSAMQFVTPLAFTSVIGSDDSVFTDQEYFNKTFLHIELARWADMFIIVPITANTIAKMANGMSDNLLLSVYLVCDKPVAISPAMNPSMWAHHSVAENIRTLQRRQVRIWGPDEGVVKCGEFGVGKLRDVKLLINGIIAEFYPKPLKNKKIIVTAGPTLEEIDSVRYISNYSSGKMGYALAQSAAFMGGKVILVSGPSTLEPPFGCELIKVKSAMEMEMAVLENSANTDFLIMAAAVSDLKANTVGREKLSKSELIDQLQIITNYDVITHLTKVIYPKPFCVGFALEYDDVVNKAQQKLVAKNVDMMIGNIIGAQTGFNSETNEVYLVTSNSVKKIPLMLKTELAVVIWIEILQLYFNLAIEE